MPRVYLQRARAKSAAATRQRIIEAARTTLADGDVPSLEVAEVAEAAGVARSTIYQVFGSRSGLMGAVIEDSLNRAGFDRVSRVLKLDDPAEAMERTLMQGCLMYESDHQTLRRLLLLAKLDKETRTLYEQRQRTRAMAMHNLAGRLHSEGHLRPGLSADAAASILWLLTSFDTYDQFHTGWELKAEDCGRRIVALAKDALLQVQPSVGFD